MLSSSCSPRVAAPRAEDVSVGPSRVQSNQDRLVLASSPRLESGGEHHMFPAVRRLVDEHPEAAVEGW